MMEIKINPEFRSLIPPLSKEELAQLEANIAKDGCRDPLVLWGGTLLDGHNRHDICTRLGLPFDTRTIQLEGDTAAKIWIICNQFGRRNITLAARCELADVYADLLEPKAKANQIRKPKSVLPKLAEQAPINSRDEAAKKAGVGHGSLDAWRKIKQHGTEEEKAKVLSDPNVKLHRVANDIKDRMARESRQQKRQEAAAAVATDERIIVGDFRNVASAVADGSVALIFTDPPYDRDAEELFEGLADFAVAKLADGGSLLMYLGHLQLPAAFRAFDLKLRHWWTCACVHEGDRALMREYGIRAGWKPMLWFVKGTRDDKSNIVFDTISGPKEKSHHDWQQSECEARYWIENLCPDDGLVCDPFIGGGTTAVAAKALGRRWVGFEIDPDTARIASERVAK